MNRKILMGCYEVPGYGGANTARYRLFERMQADGLAAAYVNLIAPWDADHLRDLFGERIGNPAGLDQVFNCWLQDKSLYKRHPELVSIVRDFSPDILVGSGFIAALLMKLAAPERRVVFLTSGCQPVKDAISAGRIKDFSSFQERARRRQGYHPLVSGPEKDAVYGCDLLITHAPVIKWLYEYYYPSQAGKMYPEIFWITGSVAHEARKYARLAQPWEQRDIDVLFVASQWDRPEKNVGMVKNIIRRCRDLRVHVAGEQAGPLGHAECHGLVSNREDLFALLGRTRTLVCPSRFDAAPGVLFEAAYMGCQVVASRNCGNWMLCHEELLAETYDGPTFVNKIRRSLAGRYPDHRELFAGDEAYRDFIDTLMVFD